MATPRTVVVSGGGSSAGILLLFVAIVGLVMLFTGNLDRIIESIAGGAGGAAGIAPAAGGASSPADTVYPPADKIGAELPKGGGKVAG